MALVATFGDLAASTSLIHSLPAKDEMDTPKHCVMDRAFKMVACDCANLNLKEIPQYLKDSIEVGGGQCPRDTAGCFSKRFL